MTAATAATVGTVAVFPGSASAESSEPTTATSSQLVTVEESTPEQIEYNPEAYAQLEYEIEQGLITDSSEADARYEELNEEYSESKGANGTNTIADEPVNPIAFEKLMAEVEAGIITSDAQAALRLAELEEQYASAPSIGARSAGSSIDINEDELYALNKAIGPLDTSKAINLGRIATKEADDPNVCGFLGVTNGKADAFRHSYWHALMARDIGSSDAKKVGDIHEKYNPGKDLANQMDYYNNAQGLKVAKRHNNYGSNPTNYVSNKVIREAVKKDINKGYMKYINAKGKLVYTNQ